MTELWRDIPGWEGLYQASNLGRIRSLDRRSPGIFGHNIVRHGRILKPQLIQIRTRSQQYRVGFTRNGKVTSVTIARAVASAWLDCPDNRKYLVINIDGDKTNNRPENLRVIPVRSELEEEPAVRRKKKIKHVEGTSGFRWPEPTCQSYPVPR